MSDAVEQTMSRFPGPVVLQPSPWWGWILFVIAATAMAGALGYAAVQGGGAWLVLIPVALPFGFSLVLLPGGNTLTLDAAGFEMRYLRFRRRRTSWPDAGDFTTVAFRGNRLVAYNDASRAGGALAKLNLAAMGRTTSLPASYGLSAADLADLLARWHVRATAGAHAPRAAAPSVADRVTVSTPVRRIVRGGMLVLQAIAIVAALLLALVKVGQIFHWFK